LDAGRSVFRIPTRGIHTVLVAIISFGSPFSLKDYKVIGIKASGEMGILKLHSFLESDIDI
jgi:hypothetical protein